MPLKRIFQKRISLLQAVFICAFISGVIYFGVRMNFEGKINSDSSLLAVSSDQLKTRRNQTGYKYSRPLFTVDLTQETESLALIKKQVTDMINTDCQNGNLYQASVYMRDMETGEWTSVNEDLTYHPGSLIKVPMLIYYLKQSEQDPNFLNKTFSIDSRLEGLPMQTYTNNSIEENKSYTIRELLKFMASYSDNKATYLLNKNADIPSFQKIFSDLGLVVPDVHDTSYSITVKDYSLFMRVLYNSTYLTPENSDFALSLLTQSSFTQGLSKELPADVTIARKFGEMKTADKRELHESGIVYYNKRPYMVTVMTKGYNPKNQAAVISRLSSVVYSFFSKK